MYQLFVGEIGLQRREFLHELTWWELKSILRGYNKRNRDMWSATRWQTYQILGAVCGSDNLHENGIYTAKDLLSFPWEKESEFEPVLSDDDIAELQADMARLNAKA